VDDDVLFSVVDVLAAIAEETGRTVPQVALNWLLRRPTVSSVIIGARDEHQLRDNLGAVGWELDPEQIARLDVVSAADAPYPYFPYRRQAAFAQLNPPLV
jgi:aryl-alcohol dehydrogenase-like predicted oxidoreductase